MIPIITIEKANGGYDITAERNGVTAITHVGSNPILEEISCCPFNRVNIPTNHPMEVYMYGVLVELVKAEKG